MKVFVQALILTIGMWGVLAFAAPLSIEDIPNGYRDGRLDVPYGTYTSVLGGKARDYQNRLSYLENKVFGLSSQRNSDDIVQAKYEYLLEAEILRLYIDLINVPPSELSTFELNSLLTATSRAYASVRKEAERLFEDMVRFIDHAKPGPNGLQIRIPDPADQTESLYLPNYRSDQLLSEPEQQLAYANRLQEFLQTGAQLDEMKILNAALVEKMAPFTRVEYVMREDNTIWVSAGKAGHILLGAGGPVRAAGQLLIIKDNFNKVRLAVLSNASGSYKPDISSLRSNLISSAFQKYLNLGVLDIVDTRGEPISTQAAKIYMKGAGVEKKILNAESAELEDQGISILTRPAPYEMCKQILTF